MAKSRDDRYPTMEALEADLERVAAGDGVEAPRAAAAAARAAPRMPLFAAAAVGRAGGGRRWCCSLIERFRSRRPPPPVVGRRQPPPPPPPQPAPPPPKTVVLHVETMPPGAEVRQGDRVFGAAPRDVLLAALQRAGARSPSISTATSPPTAEVVPLTDDSIRVKLTPRLKRPHAHRRARRPSAPKPTPTDTRAAKPQRDAAESAINDAASRVIARAPRSRVAASPSLFAAAEPPRVAPTPARDARAHYEAGQHALRSAATTTRPSPSIEQAYQLKPHPNVLYNIAQAYERLLDYARVGEVVRALSGRGAARRASSAPSSRTACACLRNLPARVSITTIPEHVHATLVDGGGTRSEAETPTLVQGAGRRLQHRARSPPGWEAERHDVHADLGQPYFYQYRLKRSTSTAADLHAAARRARVHRRPRSSARRRSPTPSRSGHHQLLLEHPDYPWHTRAARGAARAAAQARDQADAAGPLRAHRAGDLRRCSTAASPARCWSRAIGDFKGLGGTETSLPLQFGASLAGIGARLRRLVSRHSRRHQGRAQLAHHRRRRVGHVHRRRRSALGLKMPDSVRLRPGPRSAAVSAPPPASWSRAGATSRPATPRIFNSGGLWGTGTGALLAQAIFANPSLSQLGWFMPRRHRRSACITGALAGWQRRDQPRPRGAHRRRRRRRRRARLRARLRHRRHHARQTTACRTAHATRSAAWRSACSPPPSSPATTRATSPPVEALVTHEHGRWALGVPRLDIGSARTTQGPAAILTANLLSGTW